MPYYIAGQTCECLKEWHRTHVFCLVAHVTQQKENQRIQEKLSSKLCTVQSLKYCIEMCTQEGSVALVPAACSISFWKVTTSWQQTKGKIRVDLNLV